MNEILAIKERRYIKEFVLMEAILVLTVAAMFLTGFLLPLEADVLYIKYVFIGIGIPFAVLLIYGIVLHIKFVKMPAALLEKIDGDRIADRYNGQVIQIKDIVGVEIQQAQNKYGHKYPYGTVVIVTDYKKIKIKYIAEVVSAKEKIEKPLKERKEQTL